MTMLTRTTMLKRTTPGHPGLRRTCPWVIPVPELVAVVP
jgi:hypothetical protein